MSVSLPEFDFNYTNFLDKCIVLYGETKTGKSFIMVDILYQLKPHAEQIIVICPTDPQNRTYSNGMVPLPCIHYTITTKLLDDIWKRQNALGSVYKRANKHEVLKSLFRRIPVSDEIKLMMEHINKKKKERKEEVLRQGLGESDTKKKINNMEEEYTKLLTLIYKSQINNNIAKLRKMNLSQDEAFSLKYLNLNPRLVLIFDDCTDLLKKFKSHPVIQRLFYQGRWAYITALFACHTDKALDPELKKNAFISIYTEESCAKAFFERKSNDWDKEAKMRAIQACKAAFTQLAPFQKLAWLREEKQFYRLTAQKHDDFRFGSQYIWEYCNQIQAEVGSVSADNEFIREFD